MPLLVFWTVCRRTTAHWQVLGSLPPSWSPPLAINERERRLDHDIGILNQIRPAQQLAGRVAAFHQPPCLIGANNARRVRHADEDRSLSSREKPKGAIASDSASGSSSFHKNPCRSLISGLKSSRKARRREAIQVGKITDATAAGRTASIEVRSSGVRRAGHCGFEADASLIDKC